MTAPTTQHGAEWCAAAPLHDSPQQAAHLGVCPSRATIIHELPPSQMRACSAMPSGALEMSWCRATEHGVCPQSVVVLLSTLIMTSSMVQCTACDYLQVGDAQVDGSDWGGYCRHGSQLFPTWHRPYMMLIEQVCALMSDNCTAATSRKALLFKEHTMFTPSFLSKQQKHQQKQQLLP